MKTIHTMKHLVHAIACGLLAAVATFGSGCASYKASFISAYRQGEFAQACTEIQAEGQTALTHDNNGDHLIFLLEKGAACRAAGDLDQSNQALDEADRMFNKFDAKAKIRVGRQAMAAVTNLAELDYEGYGYDRIMMNAYKALNYMEQGNLDFARAELKRVADDQQIIEDRKRAKITEAEAARKERPAAQADSVDVNRTYNDPRVQSQINTLYPNLPDLAGRAIYTNAFAEYLQGIFYLHAGDASDREVGRVALRNSLGMVNNPYIQQDLQLADEIANGRATKPVTYVIFESGIAPKRDEIRIDIPIFIFNIAAHDAGVDYVGVAFPKLVPEPGGYEALLVRAGTVSYQTLPLVDMDAVIAREFKDELPAVVTRTIIAAGTKAALAYAANRATANSGNSNQTNWVNLLTRVATTAYQYGMNRADLRTWRTLPKRISMARFDTPADGMLTLSTPGGLPVGSVSLDPNAVNLVWVRGPADTGRYACRAAKLKTTTQGAKQ